MSIDLQLSKLRMKITGTSDIRDFEILQPSALLVCLTRYLGKIEIINLKTRRCLRVLSLHKPNVVSLHFNKMLVHNAGVLCCLQARKMFQSSVFICNIKTNRNISIPFEYSNSTRSIALLGDLLITAGLSSKIRFWEITTGEFVDDICFQRNSVCVSNLTPCEEKLMLVCVEETTNSMWLVSLQSKKLVRSIPLDIDRNGAILTPFGNNFASFIPNQKTISFWSVVEGQHDLFNFKFLDKTQVDSFCSFHFIEEEEGQTDQVLYTTATGLKCRKISTNQVVSEIDVNWQLKGTKRSYFNALEGGRAIQISKKNVFLHDGVNILVIS